jgi:hypothetical protein
LKKIAYAAVVVSFLISCKQQSGIIVQASFADSILQNKQEPAEWTTNSADINFWKARINPAQPGIVNEMKYASALAGRFLLKGDIKDLLQSDSVLRFTDSVFAHREAAPALSLALHALQQHRFHQADSLLKAAKTIGLKKNESAAASFDVAFESGDYPVAEAFLREIAVPNDYGYQFRKAKLAHYKGDLDTAIAAMEAAVTCAGEDIHLQQAALSNAADLYLHNAQPGKAYAYYTRSIRLSNADLHSVMGLGWVSLVHDNNDSLAERLFHWVKDRSQAPDALYKLAQAMDKRGDSVMQKKYAAEFAQIASQPVYGNMYNKYLIELYTGILAQPSAAENIAARELQNRHTPQTSAWYVWALYRNGKTTEALQYYEQQVSGRPLEGLELYWMGKMMQGTNKIYNAKQYFKAAWKNRYDLSPYMVKDLETGLEK